MIDFLCEMRDFWIWCASLLVLTGLLWTVPRTRRMPGIMMTGWKTMPAGCTLVLLVPVLGILLMHLVITLFSLDRFDSSLGRFLVIASIPFFWFPLGIVAAVMTVAGLCRFLQRKYQAEFDWMGLIFVGMMVLFYSWIFLIVCNLQIIPPIHPR